MYIKILIFVMIVALGFGLVLWDKTKTPSPVPVIPNASFLNVSGEAQNLHDFKGKTIVLNFWATWCLPCVAEFPDLLELAAQHKDQMVFIALSVDGEPEKVLPFFDRFEEDVTKKLDLENVIIGYDTNKVISRDLFETTKYPETYIIGPDLKIRRKITGLTDWPSPEIAKLVKEKSPN